MKRLVLIFTFMFIASPVFAAITERYVTTTGTDTYANSTSSSTPMSLTTAFANAAAGDRINVKSGTYTRTASDTPTNSGTVTSPIIYRGYATTIGDGNLGRTNGNGALILTNMPSIAYNATFRLAGTATFTIWESLNLSANITTAAIIIGANSVIKSCKSVNSNTGASTNAINNNGSNDIVFDCDAELTGASGGGAAISANALVRVISNRIKGGTAAGITTTSTPVIIGNVIFASGTNHIVTTNASANPTIYGNTLVGATGDAINIITGTTTLQCIVGNMITDNTGDGIDMVSTSNGAFAAYNRTRDNANGYNNAGDWLTATKYGDVTTDTGGASTDYTNSGSNDYSLIFASPAKGAGWFQYSSIGALQRNEAAAATQSARIYGQ